MVRVRSSLSARGARADNPDKVEVGRPLFYLEQLCIGRFRGLVAPFFLAAGRAFPVRRLGSVAMCTARQPESVAAQMNSFRPSTLVRIVGAAPPGAHELRTRMMSARWGRADNPDRVE